MSSSTNTPTKSIETIKELIKTEIKDKGSFAILYVDDEVELHEIMKDQFSDYLIEFLFCASSSEAIEVVKKRKNDLVLIISDLKMPNLDGFNLRLEILKIAPEIPFAILSGFIDREIALRGVETKISAFIDKPATPEKFAELMLSEVVPRIQMISENRELRAGFVDEASELISHAEEYLLAMEQDPRDQENLNRFFGIIHTIKGASAFFEPKYLHSFAHAYEDLLKKLQRNEITFSTPVAEAFFRGMDIIKILFKEFKDDTFAERNMQDLLSSLEIKLVDAHQHSPINNNDQSPSSPTKETNTNSSSEKEDIRVSVDLLDEFMQLSGEVTVIRNMLNKCFKSIERRFTADRDVSMLGDLLEELHKINGNVQSKMTEIRKIPLKSILKPLPRAIRDVSKKLGKEVELKLEGEHLRVDTSIAEVLNNSLLHIVKNSIDHGLETPEERKKNGKHPKGIITLSCIEKSDQIVVEISDDGKGINIEAIKNKMIKNGTHTLEQANQMSEEELFAMIFSSGFSTAAQVTDISGRGVGMSMVKDSVEKLRGAIEIQSQAQKGSLFRLILPVPKSVLIASCLSAKSQGQQFGFLQNDVLRVIQMNQENSKDFIRELEGTRALVMDDNLIPIVNLETMFGEENQNKKVSVPQDVSKLIIIESEQDKRRVAVEVDEILDVEDTVIKSIHPVLNECSLYRGVTFLDEGSLGIILDSDGILNRSGIVHLKSIEKKKHSAEQHHNRTSALIVDLFCQGNYALDRNSVYRLEKFPIEAIQQSGDTFIIPYRDGILELLNLTCIFDKKFMLNEIINSKDESNSFLSVVVVKDSDKMVGLVVRDIVDMLDIEELKTELCDTELSISGHFFYNTSTITMLSSEQAIALIRRKSKLFQHDNLSEHSHAS